MIDTLLRRCYKRRCSALGALVAVLALSLVGMGWQQRNNSKRIYPNVGQIKCLSRSEEPVVPSETLAKVVEQAAWTGTVHGAPRRAVMITSCDTNCLRETFEAFIKPIQNSQDGDFSQHLIIVCIREAAYQLCQSLQKQGHKHHCLLDPGCEAPYATGPDGMGFLGPDYNLALLQKTRLASALLQLDTSVAWTDMDMTYFRNPLRFLFDAAPNADLVIQSEEWEQASAFSGDVCRHVGPSVGCSSRWERMLGSAEEKRNGEGEVMCCDMPVNGGLWLMNPTPRAKLLARSWVALYFEEGVVKGKFWDRSAELDQTILMRMIQTRHRASSRRAFTYEWHPPLGKLVQRSTLERDAAEVIYRISAQRGQSYCSKSLCGWLAPRVPIRHYWRNAGGQRVSDEVAERSPGHQLVCVMPKKSAERLISFHQNCLAGNAKKRRNMEAWLNWTYDEAAYQQEATADQKRKLNPDW